MRERLILRLRRRADRCFIIRGETVNKISQGKFVPALFDVKNLQALAGMGDYHEI